MELWGLRVVAVDDDPDTLDLVRAVLQARGADFIAEASPGQALATIVGVMPDALLIDVAMPHLDGITILRKVRALCPTKGGRIPAATLSALPASAASLESWRRAGFQAHVSKPFAPDALIACITDLVSTTVERRREARPSTGWPLGVSRNRRLDRRLT